MKEKFRAGMFLLMILIGTELVFSESIFDSVVWKKDSTQKNINLSYQKNKEDNLSFYKAEITLDISDGEIFFNNLLCFEKYPEIFPKMLVCRKINESSVPPHNGFYYFILDFRPLKNRDYIVNSRYFIEKNNNEKKYILEWFPVIDNSALVPENKSNMRVDFINGRWQIIEKNGKIKISVEYYNDFKVIGPKVIVNKIEKYSVINAVRDLIKYTLKTSD
jgi:hypothetical protein